MKLHTTLVGLAVLAATFSGTASAQIIWEAFNDHRAGADTSPNATTWEMRATGSGGALKDIITGADLPVTLAVEEDGGVSDDFGANSAFDVGSPGALFFAGKCTIGGIDNEGIPGIRASSAVVLRLRFNGLDPGRRYNFRGATCRGNSYIDRWIIFKIVEADSAVAAHIDASQDLNIFTATTFPQSGILADEVVLNSGENRVGSLVGWDDIDPGADGTFAVEARQYVGVAPFGTPSLGPYAYGFSAMYLAELASGGAGFAITDLSVGEDGRVTITSNARAGAFYAIDVSTDLVQWDELTDGETAEDGKLIYTDTITEPGESPSLFYRVREL